MKAMVLAAGLGTRLRPITYSIPKPMVPVLNRPVMEHIVDLLVGQGFTRIIANLHWFPETIRSHFEDGSGFGAEISYSFEEDLLGTAGGVFAAREFFDGAFLVISGDALTDVDLLAMKEFHDSHDGVATLATKTVRDPSEFGVVITEGDGRIQGFQEKPDPAEALSNLANCGIYMFDAEIFDYFPEPGASKLSGPGDPDGFADWALDVFPALMEAGIPFYAHEIDAYWNDVGTISEFIQGSFDGLTGAVDLGINQPQVDPGIWVAEDVDLSGAEVTGPLLIGPGTSVGDGALLSGPLVIGAGCRIGERSMLKEAILLDSARVDPRAFIYGGVLGG